MESNFTEIIKEDRLIAISAGDSIPDPYNGWVTARAIAMSSALMGGAGNLLQADVVASMLRNALGLEDYKILSNGLALPNEASILPYRGTHEIERLRGDQGIQVIANHPDYNNLGKDILHPQASKVVKFSDMGVFMPGTEIPVLPGAFCENREDVEKIVMLFKEKGVEYVIKDAFGTDGSNLVKSIQGYEGGPVVVEKAVDYIGSVSVQFLNGVMGVLTENPKKTDNKWLGNTMGYTVDDIGRDIYEKIEAQVKGYALEFSAKLAELTSHNPIIFGMDFLVYSEEGDIKLAFIDPNLRMPGNLFMYYQKYLLESRLGVEVHNMRSQLIYTASKVMGAVELQNRMDDEGISLIKENGNGPEIRMIGGKPFGVYPIVQDPGELSLINIVGRSRKDIENLLVNFHDISK